MSTRSGRSLTVIQYGYHSTAPGHAQFPNRFDIHVFTGSTLEITCKHKHVIMYNIIIIIINSRKNVKYFRTDRE